jgi:hypothetical protein
MRNDRKELYFGQLAVGLAVAGRSAHGLHCPGGKGGLQVGLPDTVVESYDGIAFEDAEKLPSVRRETEQFHCSFSRQKPEADRATGDVPIIPNPSCHVRRERVKKQYGIAADMGLAGPSAIFFNARMAIGSRG